MSRPNEATAADCARAHSDTRARAGDAVRDLGLAVMGFGSDSGAQRQTQELTGAVARCLSTVIRLSTSSRDSAAIALRLTSALDSLLCKCNEQNIATEVRTRNTDSPALALQARS
eukprot:5032078-Pleurochrysis_carterae.AAC.1